MAGNLTTMAFAQALQDKGVPGFCVRRRGAQLQVMGSNFDRSAVS
ncbi:hypothetical protein [Streptomyces mirabilis]